LDKHIELIGRASIDNKTGQLNSNKDLRERKQFVFIHHIRLIHVFGDDTRRIQNKSFKTGFLFSSSEDT
jgi:hypothetical protein